MINFFNNQKTLCQIKDKADEYIVITRDSRSVTPFSINNIHRGLLQDNTDLVNGDLITEGSNKYFVTSIINTRLGKHAQLYECNSEVNIVRLTKKYINGNLVGMQENPIIATASQMQTVTAKMQQLDLGLLQNCVKTFILPVNIDLQLLDRIKIGVDKFQVDSIDNTRYDGLLYVQTSIDKRATVV